MEFGIKLPNLSALYGRDPIMRMAKKADDLGFEFVWASDHVVFPAEEDARADIGPRSFPITYRENAVDPLTALAFAAGVTERVKLGTSVLVLPFRNPIVTAKQLASIDMLSNGRLTPAVGSGWQEKEFEVVAASHKDRGRVTDEWIQIFRTCWDDEFPSFEGKFYRFDPIHFYPKPAHRIDIWMGGGSQGGWRRLARYGDGYHATALSVEGSRQAVETIKRMTEEEGRDWTAFRFTSLCDMRVLDTPDPPEPGGRRTLVGTPQEIAEYAKALEEVGFSHIAMRVQDASGSTIANQKVEPNLDRALEQMQRFHDEVLPLL